MKKYPHLLPDFHSWIHHNSTSCFTAIDNTSKKCKQIAETAANMIVKYKTFPINYFLNPKFVPLEDFCAKQDEKEECESDCKSYIDICQLIELGTNILTGMWNLKYIRNFSFFKAHLSKKCIISPLFIFSIIDSISMETRNKEGDNGHPCHIPFYMLKNLDMYPKHDQGSISNSPVLTIIQCLLKSLLV